MSTRFQLAAQMIALYFPSGGRTMWRSYRILSWLALSLTAAGCAWTNVVPVSQYDRATQGLRICEQKPLLLVTASNTSIVFIPNYSKMYAVQFGAFLAKNEFSIKVDNCSVTQLDSKLDTTAIIELLKTLANDLIAKPTGKATGGELLNGPAAILYEFIFDDEGNILALKPWRVGAGLALQSGAGSGGVKSGDGGKSGGGKPGGKTTPKDV